MIELILSFDNLLYPISLLQESDPPLSFEIVKARFLKYHGVLLIFSCFIAWIIGAIALKSIDRLKILFPKASKSILAWTDLILSLLIALAIGLFVKQPGTYNEAMVIGAGATAIFEVLVTVFQNRVTNEKRVSNITSNSNS